MSRKIEPKGQSPTLVIVPHDFLPPLNGGNIYSYNFCKYLSKLRPVICYSTFGNRAGAWSFELARMFSGAKGKFLNPSLALRLFFFCRSKKIETCILNQPFLGIVVLPVVRLLGIRMVVIVHNLEFQRFRSLGKYWWPFLFYFERFIYRHADDLFFVSKKNLEEATRIFKLEKRDLLFVPHGTYLDSSIGADRRSYRRELLDRYKLDHELKLLLIYGPLSYFPNEEALTVFVDRINPYLLTRTDFQYVVFVCGGERPKNLERQEEKELKNIRFVGFVDDIEFFLRAVDLVLNPCLRGGGAKSKVIEAVALGASVISTRTGATGLDSACFGSKVSIVADDDYEGFAKVIVSQSADYAPTPQIFYETYSWANITKRVDSHLQNTGR